MRTLADRGPTWAAKVVLLVLGVSTACAPASKAAPGPSAHEQGVFYFHDEAPQVPWSMHVVKVERARKSLEFQTTLGQGSYFGTGLVSDQARSLPAKRGKPLAAINGDFYYHSGSYTGQPEGLQIMDGELVSGPMPTRAAIWMDSDGNPHRTNVTSQFKATWPDGTVVPLQINEERESDEAVLYTSVVGASTRTRGGRELVLGRNGDGPWLPLHAGQSYTGQVQTVRQAGNTPLNREVMVLSLGPRLAAQLPKLETGALVGISTATTPDLRGAKTAIGGGPNLVHNGKAVYFSPFQARHPRTAFGWNKDYFFMVEVDGRQRELSVGMTFSELANYLVKLGCEEAINFDGGGSATMWVLGNVMNSPSEGAERPGANALVLVLKRKEKTLK